MAKKQFYLPICIDNLAQFFAFGFITPASVFPFGNYITDELSLHSNVIPLHKKPTAKTKIPRNGIQASKQEDEFVKSAIVVVSLDDSNLEQSDSSTWQYLEQILPIYLIKEIIFEDEAALEDFEYLTKTTGRVSLELLNNIDLKKGGFDKLLQPMASNELAGVEVAIDDLPSKLGFDRSLLHKMSGYGAALALTYVMAKNDAVSNDEFKKLAYLELEKDYSNDKPAVRFIASYLFSDIKKDTSKHLLQDVFFDRLLSCGSNEKVLDKLLPFFDMDIEDKNVSNFLQKRKALLIDIVKGKVESTNSKQMSAFGKVEHLSQFIEQVVTMFALLNDTEKLFNQPICSISGEGYVNIAIAYGMRDKFYEIPKNVRQIRGLECFVIECMYKYYLTITQQPCDKVKRQFPLTPTILDVLEDSEAPLLKSILSNKFDLVSKNLQQFVSVGEHSYIPEYPEKLIEVLSSSTTEFADKMINQKAFEDIDFNIILSLYEEEKSLVKQRKKFASQLKKL
ncbi:hypothetical protein VIN01S_22450 [Vibrio inusitatus NBRC 102082]|uniref:Uncharacterized protein n=1 Tax=Vibrio inusitatus NBRC 102082 TaxID=1219070 RepID=A0A4Y3HWU3_9VIBR|nr:hypothetical protein [Vibrio inusitatus]GEA51441.1 hypothetical protein VIN01S_22450 [Vibrio inusitatus NBRC 102082]